MNSKSKQQHRAMRHRRVRAKIIGTKERPRVSVFKSNRHIFVQFIDDSTGKTILNSKVVSAKKSKMKGDKTAKASAIGDMLTEKAKELGINEAEFDRGGFKFHGRVKAVAEGLKKGGIKI